MSPFATRPGIHVRLLRIAAVLAVAGSIGVLGSGVRAGSPGYRTLLDEIFDDDALGASPYGVASAGQDTITTYSGTIFGQKYGDTTAVAVVREVANPEGNCLSISDAGGAGFARVQFFPQFTTSGAKSEISFDLRRTLNVGSTSFMFSVIDNRTTPGTGRLCTLSLTDDKPLAINSLNSGFRIQMDADYHVEISLDLVAGPQDTFSIKITQIQDPKQFFEAKGLRTMIDGSELSFFTAAVDAGDGATAVNLDNFFAISY